MFRESLDVNIYVMEDNDYAEGRGFKDLIMPCIQGALKNSETVFVLRSKAQPKIDDTSKTIICDDVDRDYEAYQITNNISKTALFKKNYMLTEFDLFILDNKIGSDNSVGEKIAKIIYKHTQSRIMLLTAFERSSSDYCIDIPKPISASDNDKRNRIVKEIEAILNIYKHEAHIDKVGIFDETDEISKIITKENINKSNFYTFGRKAKNPEQLAFLKGYIEYIKTLEESDVERLCTLADERAIPIAIAYKQAAAGVVTDLLYEKIYVMHDEKQIKFYLTRFTHLVTIIGGKEIAKSVRKVIKQTPTLSSGVEKKNKGVYIHGFYGTGKGALAQVVNALSTHISTSNPPDLIESGTVTDGQALATWLFGAARVTNSPARSGILEEAQNKTLFIDEVGALSESADGQVKLLKVIEGKQYNRLFEAMPLRDVNNIKFVLATNQNVRDDLKDRCIVIEMPSLNKRYGDILALSQYFAF